MKKINLLKKLLLVFLISFISISCGDDDGGDPTPVDPLDSQAGLLNNTWQIIDENGVTKDGTIVDVFNLMNLNISGGTKDGGNFSTDHNEDSGTEVWPNSGTWTFQNGDKNKLLRNDGVVMSISISEATPDKPYDLEMRMSFSVSGGIKDGNWVFNFVAD